MNTPLTVLVLVLWLGGMWWALQTFGPLGRKRHDDGEQPGAGVVSIGGPESRWWTLLFIASHLIVLAGVVIRLSSGPEPTGALHIILFSIGETVLICLLMKCETDTVAEPKLIDLSIAHKLSTKPEYERVVLWRRAFWLSEKPLLTTVAALIALTGIAHSAVTGQTELRFVTAFGANLLVSLWVTFRYTTLAVRPSRITLHRWLSFRPISEMRMDAVADTSVQRSALQRLAGYGRLAIRSRSGGRLGIVVRRPEEFVKVITQFAKQTGHA